MIAVIFEVWPAGDASLISYIDLAAQLAPTLESAEGFIAVERFESIAEPGKFLSLSFWRDEMAVAAWRNTVAHRAAQTRGRDGLFRDYRLRVAHVLRDYGKNDRAEAPSDSRTAHKA